MRRSITLAGFLAVALGSSMFLAMVPNGATEAASPDATFLVPSNDGYGIGECVSSGSTCGRVVADAWCEAQGFVRSQSFGFGDVEATGSIEKVASSDRPISITCAR